MASTQKMGLPAAFKRVSSLTFAADTLRPDPVHVCVMGAAGQIAYALLPIIASGVVFGDDQPLVLRLLEIEPALNPCRGVAMEIEDGAFQAVEEIITTANSDEAFAEADWVVCIGGVPAKHGGQRSELLAGNRPIYQAVGESLERVAKPTVKVLVVANPANTLTAIISHFAPKIPKKNFCAMSRLDMNRTRSQVAKALRVSSDAVRNVMVWGNHSETQVPDINDATVQRGRTQEKVSDLFDKEWVRGEFQDLIRHRYNAVVALRGKQAVMSAAVATAECLQDWALGTPAGNHVTMAVYTDGTKYGIAEGIFYSMPCSCSDGEYTVVEGIEISEEVRELMRISEQELLDEKVMAGI